MKVAKQSARSAITQQALIDAALEVIAEVGLSAATTDRFARRAGVSRGAMLHHFPTREDIILAAMMHLLRAQTEEIRSKVNDVNQGLMPLSDLLDFLWAVFSGRFFYLSLEMVTEARTNPSFHQKMLPVIADFHRALDAIWSSLPNDTKLSPHHTTVVLNLTICLLRGMGVQTVLRSDAGYYSELLGYWKQLLPSLLSGQSQAMSSA